MIELVLLFSYRTAMADAVYRTDFLSLFPSPTWQTSGLTINDNRISIAVSTLLTADHPAFAESPFFQASFPFRELIPSWNAQVPSGWRLRLSVRTEASPWYSFGLWSEGEGRASVAGQADEYGKLETDTLIFNEDTERFKVRLEFFTTPKDSGKEQPATLPPPTLRFLGVALSSPKSRAQPGQKGNPDLWNKTIEGVPQRSQMVYPDGGKVWCSPTSVSMVLGFWRKEEDDREDKVRDAVAGVYDSVYKGYGNWAFAIAYAGAQGFNARILRFSSLAQLEPFIAAVFPLVLSISWNEEKGRPLDGSPVPSSNGHLTVLVGFDAEGNPIMNEPASRDVAGVRRTYRRDQLEARWLEASGGMVYLIHPEGLKVPIV